MLTLARALGRTRAELLYGSGAFRPLLMIEWLDWVALYDLEAREAEQAQRKAKGKRRSGGGEAAPRTLTRERTEGG